MASHDPNNFNPVENLMRRPETLGHLVSQLSDGMHIVERDGNLAYQVLSHYPTLQLAKNPEPLNLFSCVHPAQKLMAKQCLDRLVNTGSKVIFECQWAAPGGEWSWMEVVGIPVHSEEMPGEPLYIIATRSISHAKEREAELIRLAYLDPLTELPNRRAFELNLQQAIANARRFNHFMALFYTDIDDFKRINDKYGHEAGDMLLKAFAARVKRCIRDIDSVSRLGGDEFVIVLPWIDSITSVRRVAERVMACVRQGWTIGEHVLDATISMGVAVFPDDGADSTRLLQNVDKALYRVKNSGRNDISYYSPFH
ncbi:sensor domain-containing diguanylate cyclase [Paenibacillus piri]|uniref:Diguanylate cyclase n=1 Tax=Paenibacillus piri TaxID=2547395 RepID=A0A4R5KMQ9_9BACL|nr:sensor domain-containing diguanylate cyclase [Paenibacillus piri]TDF96188.1 diguanylate cyclase [Paenibacillus piri]